ncbi:hypothetical protein [Jiella marina]|uniref:hypothetical protein n=1 Tax=Jiella sp. LLJ827 TaxID=2917712 RepID=UPI002100B2F0|nr:hypothetical protein [Jiella sp. LLJ827]MCQ0986421.1 hypothetical protein [Jiella sp. LLJ827]
MTPDLLKDQPVVAAFARARLVADPKGRINVENAYAAFCDFAKGRGAGGRDAALPRAQFGAVLLQMAKGVGGFRAGEAITGLAWLENRARLVRPSEIGQVIAPVLDPPTPELAARAMLHRAGRGEANPLEVFFTAHFRDRAGGLVSLEAVKQAADAAGLSHRDVLAFARARGHEIRKNAWGPDYLTDLELAAPANAEAAE